ncbi:glutamate synthase-related protein [Candidatus Thiosymbion oneisti]|uniref:glutamate synthase-related protein n=1 Tax=Candidatus Thiosymbion oneisti TaxID=589554 RepID=UPI000AD06927|nr:glutamate synthase-related protein [Candidatus Thiosymbion oneisti]
MEKPIAADNKSIETRLEAGETYYWCACGKSAKQPFCDGSHKGSSFTPKPFKAEESEAAYLCMCKLTKHPPYCDGSHKSIGEIPLDQGTETKTPNLATPTPEEPQVAFIHELAENGLSKTGHHGEVGAMGIPGPQLPKWDDIQILTAQLATKPLLDDVEIGTDLIIGRNAEKPLVLKIPLLVSDMSFGALSEEAKVALARGAELAGTGICSGEGGMLPEEQSQCSRYFYELASAKFGYSEDLLPKVQAFHFKGGQGAKTGTGGHLPGNKVKGKIAAVRQLEEGTDAVSPATFSDLSSVDDFRTFGDRVRALTGGIPIGFKLSAQHIEEDIEFAIQAGADYIILDGRGGGTGAAPLIFRDHISVPTIPALVRARSYLDKNEYAHVSLIITGGLRTPADFVKALCLGADGIALSNAAMQAIGCVAARMCNTNNCPAGIATQRLELRKQVDPGVASKRLARFLESSVELMKLLARACGHRHFSQFSLRDLTTWKKEMSDLSGVRFGGVNGYPS